MQLVFYVASYAQISYPGSFEDYHLLPLKSATIGTKYSTYTPWRLQHISRFRIQYLIPIDL